jgi:hypothetical protein
MLVLSLGYKHVHLATSCGIFHQPDLVTTALCIVMRKGIGSIMATFERKKIRIVTCDLRRREILDKK